MVYVLLILLVANVVLYCKYGNYIFSTEKINPDVVRQKDYIENGYHALLEDLIQIRGQGGKRSDFIHNLRITSEKNAKVIKRRSDQKYFLVDNLSTGFYIYNNDGTKISEIDVKADQNWENNLVNALGE